MSFGKSTRTSSPSSKNSRMMIQMRIKMMKICHWMRTTLMRRIMLRSNKINNQGSLVMIKQSDKVAKGVTKSDKTRA